MKRQSGRGRWSTRLGCALLAGVLVGALVGIASSAHAQAPSKSATMDAIKKRGQLNCGVDTGIPGYAYQDSAGKWQGLDVALCRAIAVAVLGDADKVKYIGLT
jgi:general L-amino acid transport system substrate-binding protein